MNNTFSQNEDHKLINPVHYNDVTMGAIASQITSLTVYGLLNRLFGRRSKKTSKFRVTGLCAENSPGPVNFPHKWLVTRKMFPFDDVIMVKLSSERALSCALNNIFKSFFKRKYSHFEVCWKRVVFTRKIMTRSQHTRIAQLPWHMQNCELIRCKINFRKISITSLYILWHGSLLLTWVNLNPSSDK